METVIKREAEGVDQMKQENQCHGVLTSLTFDRLEEQYESDIVNIKQESEWVCQPLPTKDGEGKENDRLVQEGNINTNVQPEVEKMSQSLPDREDVKVETKQPTHQASKKAIRQRGKRKLIIDEVKELPDGVIKSQLKNTSDIVAALDIAPPTKKLMLWKENSGNSFFLPARQHSPLYILSLYKRNLTADIPNSLRSVRDEDV